MGLAAAEIKALKAGALLHDIGKLAVPDHILNKPGKLTEAEFERMKVHTTVGAQILERVGFPYPVVPIVLYHHEQWDGRGYPDGSEGRGDTSDGAHPLGRGLLRLGARGAPVPARDDAWTRLARCCRRGAGGHFDPRVVEVFLRHLPRFDEEIRRAGLDNRGLTNEECEHRDLLGEEPAGEAVARTRGRPPLRRAALPEPDHERAPRGLRALRDRAHLRLVARHRGHRLGARQQGRPRRPVRHVRGLSLRRGEGLRHGRARRGAPRRNLARPRGRAGRGRRRLRARQSPLVLPPRPDARLHGRRAARGHASSARWSRCRSSKDERLRRRSGRLLARSRAATRTTTCACSTPWRVSPRTRSPTR